PPQKASHLLAKAAPCPSRVSTNNLSAKQPPTSVSCVLPNLIRPKVYATRVRPSAARPERQVSNVNCQYQRQRQKRSPPSPALSCPQTDSRHRAPSAYGSEPLGASHLCSGHRRRSRCHPGFSIHDGS